MTDPVTDPGLLSALADAPSEKPVTDPELLKQLEGEEPSFLEKVTIGATNMPRAAMATVGQLLPESKPAQESESKKTAKIPQRRIEGFDPAIALGELLNPLPMAAAYKLGKSTSPLLKTSAGPVAGMLASLSEPVPEGTKDFWGEKGKQATTGLMVGFGFTLGGKALSKSAELVGNYLLSKSPQALENNAVQRILKRISQDEKAGGLSAQDALDLVTTAQAEGKPMTLADAGGRNLRGLAGNVARQPGESSAIAEKTLAGRDENAASRLQSDVARYIHGGETAFQTTEMLLQARTAAARPLYQETDALQGIWSPRLQDFLNDQDVKKGMARGFAIERRNALAEHRPFDPTQLGVDLNAAGEIEYLKVPNMRVLDMGKQGLDAMIAESRNELTGRLSADGVSLDKMRRAYVDVIDSLDSKGVYKKARQAWAGPSASLDAVRRGRAVFGHSPEENAAYYANLPPGEQEFARIGVADQLMERLGKTGLGGDDAKALIKNPSQDKPSWMRDQLKPFFRNEKDYDSFVDAVTRENKMFETKRKILGGSESADRLMEDQHGAMDIAKSRGFEIAHQLWFMHPLRAAANMYRLHRDLGMRPDPKFNEAIAKIIFADGSPEATLAKDLFAQKPPPPPVTSRNAPSSFAPYLAAIPPGKSAGSEEETPEPPKPPTTRFDAQGNPIAGPDKRSSLEDEGRVVSDADPDPIRPGAQYAMENRRNPYEQVIGGRVRGGEGGAGGKSVSTQTVLEGEIQPPKTQPATGREPIQSEAAKRLGVPNWRDTHGGLRAEGRMTVSERVQRDSLGPLWDRLEELGYSHGKIMNMSPKDAFQAVKGKTFTQTPSGELTGGVVDKEAKAALDAIMKALE